jgi:hypothetical protein
MRVLDSRSFRLCDVQLFIGNDRLDPLTCDLTHLNRVTAVSVARLSAMPGPANFMPVPWSAFFTA